MRVLVTGGSGFIGMWTTKTLLELGYDVAVLDIRKPPIDVEYHIVDIRNFKEYEKVARKYDAVIHLAAIASVEEASRSPRNAVRTNIEGTLNVIEVAKERSQRIVYASSAAVYGEPKYLPIDEEHPLSPKSLYGATKLSAETLVLSYSESYGVSAVILRYFNVYGPPIGSGTRAGVIYKFLTNILNDEPLIVFGDGTQIRDFVYVEDIARLNALVLKKGKGIYNVGTGKGITIIDLISLINKITGTKSKVVHLPPRKDDIKMSIADIRRIKKIGWEPLTDLEEGLRRTWKWLRENHLKIK